MKTDQRALPTVTAQAERTTAALPLLILSLVMIGCGMDVGEPGFAGATLAEDLVAPSTVPGRIEAENFKSGGEGVGYHETTPGNLGGAYRATAVDLQACQDERGGFNVGWVEGGEWLAYDLSASKPGPYQFTARVSSGVVGTKTLHLVVNGQALPKVSFTDASGWQSFRDLVLGEVDLSAGANTARIVFDTQKVNFNYLDAQAVCRPASCASLARNCGPVSDGCGGTLSCGTCPSDLLADLRVIGFSTSRSGLGFSKEEFLKRLQQMSTASGISVATLKSKVWAHQYNPGINWNAATLGSFQWVAHQGLAGIIQNQRPQSLQTWAQGGYDDDINAYLASASTWAKNNGTRAILILHHEPENDTTAAEAELWSMGQARFVKLAREHDDPNVIACVNLMFYPGDKPPSAYDFTDEVLELCNGNQTCKQKILDRTLLGFDPYPEVKSGGTLGTVLNKIGDDITWWKARGLKYFFLPEVGLFHWDLAVSSVTNPAGIVPLTDQEQARRIHDNFCVDLLPHDVKGLSYFDVSDWSDTNYRSPTRELGAGKIGPDGTRYATPDAAAAAAPQELSEFARVIINQPHSRP